MVEQGLTFEHYNRTTGELERLPITEVVLRDPQYTGWVLRAIMEYGLPELKKNRQGELKRTANALTKAATPRWWEMKQPVHSVLDLVSMSDQQLLDSHADWLGPKRISLFRKAWQAFQELRESISLPL